MSECVWHGHKCHSRWHQDKKSCLVCDKVVYFYRIGYLSYWLIKIYKPHLKWYYIWPWQKIFCYHTSSVWSCFHVSPPTKFPKSSERQTLFFSPHRLWNPMRITIGSLTDGHSGLKVGHYCRAGGGRSHCNPLNSLTSSSVTRDFHTCTLACLEMGENIPYQYPPDTSKHTHNWLWMTTRRPICCDHCSSLGSDNLNETSISRPIPIHVFPSYSPLLALKSSLREEISLEESGARLPETVPENIPRIEQHYWDCTIHSRCCSRPSELLQHYLIHLQGRPPVS